MINIHKEGRLIVLISFLAAVALIILMAVFLPGPAFYISLFVVVPLFIMVVRFFRVPDRRPFMEDGTITAPADGKVVAIERVHQEEYLQGPALQISVFMSFHDVHINYFPVNGQVEYVRHHPGKYLIARHPKSSTLNERTSVGIRNSSGPLLVRQIAGYVARRIRCYAVEGTRAVQGSELGFIRFGSRVDLFIPPDAEVLVSMNQRVTGSITPLARIRD